MATPNHARSRTLRGAASAMTMAAVAVLTACAPGAPTPADPAPASGTAASTPSTGPATSAAPTTSTSASGATPAGPSSPGGATCASSSLQVSYADDEGGGTAGSTYGAFTLVNTSAAACTLRGFPGVSYVGRGNGTQIGAAAVRSDDQTTAITLPPGQQAVAQLRRVSIGPYGDECQERRVDGFRFYPPGSKAAKFVKFPTQGCANSLVKLLTVSPVRR